MEFPDIKHLSYMPLHHAKAQQVSIKGCWHQFNTKGVPLWGFSEKGNFIQCNYLNCDTAWL